MYDPAGRAYVSRRSQFSGTNATILSIHASTTVYDCAGLSKNFTGTSVLEQSLSLAKQNGKVIVVAVFEKPMQLDANVIVRKGIHLMGSWTWSREEFDQALELITSGAIDRKMLVTHRFSLEDASEAYETQLQAEEAIKVMFTP